MTMIDVKECSIDRSRVVVHIRPFKLLKTLYGSCFMLARKPPPINSERRKYYCTYLHYRSTFSRVGRPDHDVRGCSWWLLWWWLLCLLSTVRDHAAALPSSCSPCSSLMRMLAAGRWARGALWLRRSAGRRQKNDGAVVRSRLVPSTTARLLLEVVL